MTEEANNPIQRREMVIVASIVFGLAVLLKLASMLTYEGRARSTCMSNLKQIGLGTMQYVRDYDERMPPASRWDEVTQPYIRSRALLNCPKAENGYAMNRLLSFNAISYSKSIKVPYVVNVRTTPMYYDSTLQRPNAYDTGQSWPVPGRHRGGNNIVFMDGHVEWLQERPIFKPLKQPPPAKPKAKKPTKKR